MKKCFVNVLVGSLLASASLHGEEEKTSGFTDAFKNGKIKGTIGTYLEYTDFETEYKNSNGIDQPTDNFSWQTAYLILNYQTARWNSLKLGAEFIAHGEIFSKSESDRDYYARDIETKTALSEIYLDYAFTDKLSLVAGRWNHKFTHIDDSHSQGLYLRSQGEDLEWFIGAMSKFAELDYDDMEPFSGRDNNNQDLSNKDVYGEDSSDYLLFGELIWNPVKGIELNPYLYYQGGYATVAGLDGTFSTSITDDVKGGVDIKGHYVASDVDGRTDSQNWIVEPFIKVAGFTFSLGYGEFSGDDDNPALTRPRWFKDYMHGFDQDREYATQNLAGTLAKIKYKNGKFGAHLYYGMYEQGNDRDREINLTEFQVKYKFSSNVDANIRLFDMDFNGDAAKADYQKVEARVRYRF